MDQGLAKLSRGRKSGRRKFYRDCGLGAYSIKVALRCSGQIISFFVRAENAESVTIDCEDFGGGDSDLARIAQYRLVSCRKTRDYLAISCHTSLMFRTQISSLSLAYSKCLFFSFKFVVIFF